MGAVPLRRQSWRRRPRAGLEEKVHHFKLGPKLIRQWRSRSQSGRAADGRRLAVLGIPRTGRLLPWSLWVSTWVFLKIAGLESAPVSRAKAFLLAGGDQPRHETPASAV